jgi:hypothetical protein
LSQESEYFRARRVDMQTRRIDILDYRERKKFHGTRPHRYNISVRADPDQMAVNKEHSV